MKQGCLAYALLTLVFFSSFSTAKSSPSVIKDLQPTLILISIDGFRNDYLTKLSLPNLSQLAKKGVHSPLQPVFPSITFPNHYSIATGLYPEHHGIIMNEFVTKDMKEPFTYVGHRLTVSDPNWWKGEPIWVSAEKQGQRTASASWPISGFTIQGIKPSYYQEYPEDSAPEIRVSQLLNWLDLPKNQRPTLLMAYFENLDNAGHKAGPNSQEVSNTAYQIDEAIGHLVTGLEERGIASEVNLVIVSDHGMSPIDPNKIIDLTRIIPKKDLLAITDSDAVVAIYPKAEKVNQVYHALKKANKGMSVYRETEIPPQFHFNSSHTPPILCVADEQGYLLGKDKEPQKGTHGYNPKLQSMQAVFIATGPAFKKEYTRTAVENINLYSLFAKLLQIQPEKNDGSLAAIADVLQQS